MTIIANIDGPNRRIYLHADTVGTNLHPIDIYREMRSLRASDENLRKYDLFISAQGNISKGGGKFTERYIILLQGTRIVPYDTDQSLTITGTVITDDGQEGIAAFDRTLLSPSTIVDINYVPPQVEVITISVGSAVTSNDIVLIGNEVNSQISPKIDLIPKKVWDYQKSLMVVSGSIGEYVSKKLVSLKEWYSQ